MLWCRYLIWYLSWEYLNASSSNDNKHAHPIPFYLYHYLPFPLFTKRDDSDGVHRTVEMSDTCEPVRMNMNTLPWWHFELIELPLVQKHDFFNALLTTGLIAGLFASYMPQVRPLVLHLCSFPAEGIDIGNWLLCSFFPLSLSLSLLPSIALSDHQ